MIFVPCMNSARTDMRSSSKWSRPEVGSAPTGATSAKLIRSAVQSEDRSVGFVQGDPYRTIAALGLHTTLVCVLAFSDAWRGAQIGGMAVPGVTDDQGNGFVISRLLCSKFPLLVVLAELSEQLRVREQDMGLFCVPLNQNLDTDTLTNSEFAGFRLEARVGMDVDQIPRRLLPKMLEYLARGVSVRERLLGSRTSGSVMFIHAYAIGFSRGLCFFRAKPKAPSRFSSKTPPVTSPRPVPQQSEHMWPTQG